MMKSSTQVANRFREVFLNGKWVAYTNYKEQLLKTSWKQATRQIDTLNTIAALTFHINYYVAGVLNVFNGGGLEIRDKYSFDMPPVESEEAWNHMVETLLTNAEQFASHIEQLSDEQLEDVFVDEKYGNYRKNIDGMIEHSYYHLGQISLIRKMLEARGQ